MHYTSGKQLIIKQIGHIPKLEISGKHVLQKFPCIAELQAGYFSEKNVTMISLLHLPLKQRNVRKA